MFSGYTAESDVLRTRTLTHRSCTSILTKRGKLREHSSEEEIRVLAVAQERLTESNDESASLRDQLMYSTSKEVIALSVIKVMALLRVESCRSHPTNLIYALEGVCCPESQNIKVEKHSEEPDRIPLGNLWKCLRQTCSSHCSHRSPQPPPWRKSDLEL